MQSHAALEVGATHAVSPATLMRWVIATLFALTYIGISARRLRVLPIGRPAVALVGACALVLVGHWSQSYGLHEDEALAAVEPNTIALLFGMMVISSCLGESGFFSSAATWMTRHITSRVGLLYTVCISAGFLSALLVNDAVCVLFTPLVMRVVRRTRAPVEPFVFAIAMGSNAGSALTLSGNPQNMLVARLSGISYRSYLATAWLPSLLALGFTAVLLHAFERRSLSVVHASEAVETSEPHVTSNPVLQRVALSVVLGVMIVNLLGGSLAWSALFGASIVLIASGTRASEILSRVEWSVLVFFAALFIVVAAMRKTGLPAQWLSSLPAAKGVWLHLMLVLVLALGSQIVSNVPLILLLEPWIRTLPDPTLAWTLTAIVSTLAGNLTLLGSVANVIVIEQSGTKMGFFDHLRRGLPLTVVSITVAVLALFAMR